MKRLLQIEFLKIRSHKASVRLSLIYFTLIILLSFLSKAKISFGSMSTTLSDLGVYEFPLIWHFGSYMALFLKLILVIVVISSVTGEYSNLTLKQNLIDGLSKKEFLLSKILMALVLSILSVLFVFINLFIVGWNHTEVFSLSVAFSELDYLLGYFIRLFGFLCFGIFAAVLLKRSALALGFMAVWWIVEGIVFLFLKKFFDETGVFIANLLPFSSMDNTVSNPFQRIDIVNTAAQQLGQKIDFVHGVHYMPMLQSVLWIMLLLFLAYRLLSKRDL